MLSRGRQLCKNSRERENEEKLQQLCVVKKEEELYKKIYLILIIFGWVVWN